MMKPAKVKFKHLTLEDRRSIQGGIEQGSTLRGIAQTMAKDPSSIAKEIRLHRVKTQSRSLSLARLAFVPIAHGIVLVRAHLSRLSALYLPAAPDRSPAACKGCAAWPTVSLYQNPLSPRICPNSGSKHA